MEEVLNFLRELRANNNREWFTKHKDQYLAIKDYITGFTQTLINEISSFDGKAKYLSPADCTYRIYRDTRFSTDKTPYKTHIGIFINPPSGKKSNRMGYYLHIEPDKAEIGAGNVGLPPKIITGIRQSIKDNIEEYLDIIENPQFKKLFPTIGFNLVKTAPKGFSQNWEYISLVRPKDYYVSHPLKDRELKTKDFVGKASEIFSITKPFCDFINYTIDELNEESELR